MAGGRLSTHAPGRGTGLVGFNGHLFGKPIYPMGSFTGSCVGKQPEAAWKVSANCLETAWTPPCLQTAWKLHETAWKLPDAVCELPGNCLKTAWEMFGNCYETALGLPGSCLEAAWKLSENSLESAW